MHTHAAMGSSKHCLAILGRLHKVLQVLQLFATGSSVVALDDLGCFVSPNCDSSSTSRVSQMYLSRSWEPNSRIAWQVSHKMGLELSNTEVMWLLGGSRWIDWELNLTTDPGLSCRLAPQKLSDLSSLVEGKVCPSDPFQQFMALDDISETNTLWLIAYRINTMHRMTSEWDN
jgi:hypothetical protein